jgi:hypothetical protein
MQRMRDGETVCLPTLSFFHPLLTIHLAISQSFYLSIFLSSGADRLINCLEREIALIAVDHQRR